MIGGLTDDEKKHAKGGIDPDFAKFFMKLSTSHKRRYLDEIKFPYSIKIENVYANR